MYKNYQNYTIIKNNKKTLFENVKYYTQIECNGKTIPINKNQGMYFKSFKNQLF